MFQKTCDPQEIGFYFFLDNPDSAWDVAELFRDPRDGKLYFYNIGEADDCPAVKPGRVFFGPISTPDQPSEADHLKRHIREILDNISLNRDQLAQIRNLVREEPETQTAPEQEAVSVDTRE